MNIDYGTIGTILGTSVTIIGVTYTFLRNFKEDINSHIDRIDKKIEQVEKRMIENNAKTDLRVMETNKRMDGVYNILLKRMENLK